MGWKKEMQKYPCFQGNIPSDAYIKKAKKQKNKQAKQ